MTTERELLSQLLLAYAGPASNVRVERASRYCFNEGGALADVMSLYENTSENVLGDQQEEGTEVREQGNSHMAIEVYYVFFVFVHTILNFRSLSGYAFLLGSYAVTAC